MRHEYTRLVDDLSLRLATEADASQIEALIEVSVYGLLREFHDRGTLDSAMGAAFGLDRQLIADGTYFVVTDGARVVGCGGWSMRRRPFGGDATQADTGAELLDPAVDPARIRAFFVDPAYARRGIGSRIMRACEEAILASAFSDVQISATLAGEKLYARFGYAVVSRDDIELPDGASIEVVLMAKALRAES